MATVLITGANRGIGLELCRQYVQRGDQVFAACRVRSDGLGALGVRVIDRVDVCDPESLSTLASRMAVTRLDLLVNNAGVLWPDELDTLDDAQILRQFEVNALGPLRVTRALLSLLGPGSRVGIVTSRMGSIGDNSSGGYYGYRMSKAAVNMAGVSLAQDLRERGVAVGLVHPGMVATDMTGGQGIAVSEAARGLVRRFDALDLDHSGGFWHANGESLPW